MTGPFPEDSAERKTYPVHGGVMRYFPAALAKVAHHSYLGNEKHNPGQPLHWARGKSDDHLDAAGRHLIEGDLAGAAWRILAALQLECEAQGAPMAPGASEGCSGVIDWGLGWDIGGPIIGGYMGDVQATYTGHAEIPAYDAHPLGTVIATCPPTYYPLNLPSTADGS